MTTRCEGCTAASRWARRASPGQLGRREPHPRPRRHREGLLLPHDALALTRPVHLLHHVDGHGDVLGHHCGPGGRAFGTRHDAQFASAGPAPFAADRAPLTVPGWPWPLRLRQGWVRDALAPDLGSSRSLSWLLARAEVIHKERTQPVEMFLLLWMKHTELWRLRTTWRIREESSRNPLRGPSSRA